MLRRLFTLLSALSLLLCLAVAAAWGASYFRDVSSFDGRVLAFRLDGDPFYAPNFLQDCCGEDEGADRWFRLRSRFAATTGQKTSWQWRGIEYHHEAADSFPGYSGTFSYALVAVPYWLILAVIATPLAGLLLLAFMSRWRQHQRKRGDLCPSCGYDLRATPGRCPECGYVSTLGQDLDRRR